MAELKKIISTTKLFCNTAKQRILQWAAQRPILVLILIICFSIILLPAITVAALTPVAMIFTYSDVLMSKGGFNVLYAVLFQGFLIAVVIVALFVICFTLGIFLSVIHSYRSHFLFIPQSKQKKM